MLVKCQECNEEVDAKEQVRRHKCGLLYGLTPYFPFDDKYLRKKGRHLHLDVERY
jgi:hypothetical protein